MATLKEQAMLARMRLDAAKFKEESAFNTKSDSSNKEGLKMATTLEQSIDTFLENIKEINLSFKLTKWHIAGEQYSESKNKVNIRQSKRDRIWEGFYSFLFIVIGILTTFVLVFMILTSDASKIFDYTIYILKTKYFFPLSENLEFMMSQIFVIVTIVFIFVSIFWLFSNIIKIIVFNARTPYFESCLHFAERLADEEFRDFSITHKDGTELPLETKIKIVDIAMNAIHENKLMQYDLSFDKMIELYKEQCKIEELEKEEKKRKLEKEEEERTRRNLMYKHFNSAFRECGIMFSIEDRCYSYRPCRFCKTGMYKFQKFKKGTAFCDLYCATKNVYVVRDSYHHFLYVCPNCGFWEKE